MTLAHLTTLAADLACAIITARRDNPAIAPAEAEHAALALWEVLRGAAPATTRRDEVSYAATTLLARIHDRPGAVNIITTGIDVSSGSARARLVEGEPVNHVARLELYADGSPVWDAAELAARAAADLAVIGSATPGSAPIYYCCGVACPGLPWRASERPHPDSCSACYVAPTEVTP